MDFNFIIQRVIGIVTKPNEEWKKIKGEKATVAGLFTNFAIIVAAIPAIAGLIGWMIIGRSFMGITIRVPFMNSFMWMILTYVFSLVGVYLLALIIDFLAPNFGTQKDMVASTKIAVYSYAPAWVAGILNIIPALAMIGMIVGLYSLYLLYLGIKALKEPKEDKALPYFGVVIVVGIVISFLIYYVVGAIAFGSARAFF
jgi:hypothetical protein